jgi:uncharacterized protein YggU (UPF0235/DUF167 family)
MKYIKVIAKTKARKENIVQKSKDHFEVSVKEKAENNMANKRIIEILAMYFKVSIGKIRIINGHHHPHKLLIVEDEI